MALSVNKPVVSDSLIHCFDAGNVRSFPGEATTNLFTNPSFENSGSGWVKTGYVKTEQVRGRKENKWRLRFDKHPDAVAGSHHRAYQTVMSLNENTTYTFSAWFKRLSDSERDYTITFIVTYQDSGGTLESNLDSFTIPAGGWQRISYTTTSPAGTDRALIYFYRTNTANAHYIVSDPQFEEKDHTTPFVDGTREAEFYSLKSGVAGATTEIDFDNQELNFNSVDGKSRIMFDDILLKNNLIDFTVDIWFKRLGTANISYHCLASSLSGGGNRGRIMLTESTEELYFEWQDSVSNPASRISTTNTHAVGETAMYTVVKSSTDGLIFYKNGTQFYQDDTATLAMLLGGTMSYIGRVSTYIPNGQIPILRAYSRVLTPAEILQNFNAHKTRFGL